MGYVHDDLAGVLRRRGPVHRPAELVHRRFELLQVTVEMSERMFLEAFGVVAQPVAVSQGGVTAPIARHRCVREPDERRLEGFVGQRLGGGAGEIMMFVALVMRH